MLHICDCPKRPEEDVPSIIAGRTGKCETSDIHDWYRLNMSPPGVLLNTETCVCF